MDLGVSETFIQSPTRHLLAGLLYRQVGLPLSLSVLSYKMEVIITAPASQGCGENEIR